MDALRLPKLGGVEGGLLLLLLLLLLVLHGSPGDAVGPEPAGTGAQTARSAAHRTLHTPQATATDASTGL